MTRDDAARLTHLLEQAHADACRLGLPFSVRARFEAVIPVVVQVNEGAGE